MSASDPTKKNEKTQGVSKRILVVDYLPTQAILDTLDYELPFQDSIKDFPEYDKDSTGHILKTHQICLGITLVVIFVTFQNH